MGIDVGWFDTGAGPARTIWHTGTVPNFSATAAMLPEQKLGVALLRTGLMLRALRTAGPTRPSGLRMPQEGAPP